MSTRLSDFLGDWTINRRVRDDLSGLTYRFLGSLNVSWQDESKQSDVEVVETGVITFEHSTLNANRRSRWRQHGESIDVYYDTGLHFHDFHTREETCDVRHECGDDVYLGRYCFRNWPEWRLNWRVNGPKKGYRMVSVYRKSEPPE